MQYVIFFGAIIAIIIIAKILSWPLKIIFKLLINIGLGIAAIALINIFGTSIGLYIPFNMITAVVAGFLGLPGVVILIIFSYLL